MNSQTRVLIIEDNEDDYLIVRDLLGDIAAHSFEIIWVETVESARAALDSQSFDVCLVDHRLTGRSGLVLIEEQTFGDPPFILLTGDEDRALDLAAAKAGAMDYLLKGHINASLLERSIRYAMERAKQAKTLEAALGQARLLAMAVENLTDGMVITDARQADNPIIFVNGAFIAMTGYASAEVLGRNCCFLQGTGTDPQTVQQMREAIREGRPFRGVILNYRKDGTPFWNGLKLMPVVDGEGHLKHFVGLQSDITARREAEIALSESEARKTAIFEAALDGILTIDHRNTVVELNSAAERIFGISRARAMGRSAQELIPFLVPGLEAPGKLEALEAPGGASSQSSPNLAGRLRGEEIHLLGHQIELMGQRADGNAFPAELALTRIEVKGEPLFIAHVRDITERKAASQAVARLAAIVESSSDAIISVKSDGLIISWNAGAEALYGYTAAEAMGQSISLLVAPDRLGEETTFLAKLKEGERVADYETVRVCKNGRHLEVSITVSPIRDETREVVGTSAISRDISDRKRAESALRESQARSNAVIQNALDCIITIDHEDRVLEFNPAAETTFGYRRDEAMGQILNDLIIPPAFHDSHKKGMRHYLETGEGSLLNRRLEMPALRKDGSEITVELAVTAVEHSDPPQFIAYLRDVTERNRNEVALRESEERFQSIVANVPGMVYQFVVRPDGSIEWPFVSEGYREIREVHPETFQRDPLWPLSLIHPDDKASFDRSLALSAQTLSPWHWEGRHRLESGKIRWIQGASRPQRLPDGGTLWNGLIVDTTALKEAEAERDRFFTMSLDMLGTAGLDGYFKHLNPAFSETSGYTEAELLTRPFIDFVHPEDRASTAEAIESLAAGNTLVGFENRYQSKDGSYKWLEWKAAAVLEEGLIYAAARDVTARKTAEAALLRTNDDLEERVAARTAELEQANLALQFQITEREDAEAENRARAPAGSGRRTGPARAFQSRFRHSASRRTRAERRRAGRRLRCAGGVAPRHPNGPDTGCDRIFRL